MSCFIYILSSEKQEMYYTGVSNSPKRRLYFHNNSDTKKYTLRYRPWALVYTHGFKTNELALATEKKVKSWNSKKMFKLLVKGKIKIEDYL